LVSDCCIAAPHASAGPEASGAASVVTRDGVRKMIRGSNRLRKSIGLASLLRVNLFNQPLINGRKRGSRVTVGLPGSGLSYQFGTSQGRKSPAWITSIWGWIVLALVVVCLLQLII
jgi:hypothetical protein